MPLQHKHHDLGPHLLDGFVATPELMRTVAGEILAQAANGFALIRAAVELENGWVAALDAVGIKVAGN